MALKNSWVDRGRRRRNKIVMLKIKVNMIEVRELKCLYVRGGGKGGEGGNTMMKKEEK